MASPVKNILLCCTGSVATIKVPIIIKCLIESGLQVRLVFTKYALHFCSHKEISSLGVLLYSDEDEWNMWNNRGDPVLHIELVKWADLLLIAPLDANTLAKISQGICDNLITCIVRAWDLKNKKLLFSPAMNTKMWEHPITSSQISVLKSWGYQEIPCISKTLMCGDTGLGAMAEPETIVNYVKKYL